ncbi:Ies3p NDAI_0G03240 [Naumovozyma dairenensis CBS 421]|uniref:Uncharacterized protein n=1 Tax=Naumovozyma dairenensis (strain ATCC 10597 / BCRC 20456 / CBS 421 / NBRC 0211 / NRRL Y-12639) TaxID=1071378 RepID=G0WE90_NAUDC|nr:hypothetical protein NDAI_0G03240 [Naumovozyma dairenensis CBS 421]CCD26101.2 hypothetical protein NDAI_0G03240 [Naumovozyma dairenensis CBS 421]
MNPTELEFQRLLAEDKQVQYAYHAIKKYKNDLKPDLTSLDKDQNTKRHIMNIDDVSKINYEVIKTVPGTFIATASREEQDINALKATVFKDDLFRMNDKFAASINGRVEEIPNLKVEEDEVIEGDSEVDLLFEKIGWLTKIQTNLINEYKNELNEERKWFTLNEIVLDANAELDLFSVKNRNRKRTKGAIDLGAAEVATQSFSSTLAFNRPKRRKVAPGKISNVV